MDNAPLVEALNNELQLNLPVCVPESELVQNLTEFIDYLIQNDFQRLVFILYRTDVSEAKLKLLLQQNTSTNTAGVIAGLIIERTRQKMHTKRQFIYPDVDPHEEKW